VVEDVSVGYTVLRNMLASLLLTVLLLQNIFDKPFHERTESDILALQPVMRRVRRLQITYLLTSAAVDAIACA
jgi:hypothetical protein